MVGLAGLTMGVLGFGPIQQQTGRIALALEMDAIAHDVCVDVSPIQGVRMVDLDALFRETDTVSILVPLTPETEGLVDADLLGSMKEAAFLISTSRGQPINEPDLAKTLSEGRLAGAGLDVLAEEPPSMDGPLLHAQNCYITPHISWATKAARARLMQTAVDSVKASWGAGRRTS